MSKPTFEENLKSLELIVKKLESGDLSLDESVKIYNEGIELAKECHKELKDAEQIIVKLMNDDQLEDFNQE
ncbi:MAG: exodeoxyribonuclease VII small subunit [Candidatus Izemoplasmatales bacterium]|uniref:Exodeoxyribonuclease 7 small subunit n=1 Tax=Hujiaoplasma nucleasis TaxID=2725268 RepID=A0A7L6N3V9_9MOLU|nr:exodeoxyribonuclease VII small subunit [Hujiaoplasma nucleasis]QLY39735.1 exodeoxyribonuclease VII small subunit [Hujiaoplasma nucleasis]